MSASASAVACVSTSTLCTPARIKRRVSRRVAFPALTSLGSRWKYSRASRYIAVSNHVKSILAASGIPEEKIDVRFEKTERRFDHAGRVFRCDADSYFHDSIGAGIEKHALKFDTRKTFALS